MAKSLKVKMEAAEVEGIVTEKAPKDLFLTELRPQIATLLESQQR
jgi:hypothetical protein